MYYILLTAQQAATQAASAAQEATTQAPSNDIIVEKESMAHLSTQYPSCVYISFLKTHKKLLYRSFR